MEWAARVGMIIQKKASNACAFRHLGSGGFGIEIGDHVLSIPSGIMLGEGNLPPYVMARTDGRNQLGTASTQARSIPGFERNGFPKSCMFYTNLDSHHR
jgi:hypothetical protein